MQAALELLRPCMADSGTEKLGRACIGTVRGDMHDIGKNLVKIMMEGSGIEVVDLGVDVAPEKFVEAALHQNCGIIACSSLLTTTMQEMRDVVRLAEEMGIRGRVKILVAVRLSARASATRSAQMPTPRTRLRRPRGGVPAPQRAVRV